MSKNKQKGTHFETSLVPFLQLLWPYAKRTGSADYGGGDFENTWPFLIEAKNRKDLRLGEWMKQVEAAAKRIKERSGITLFPVVIHKRRNFGSHRAYVTMPVESWLASVLHLLDMDDAARQDVLEQLHELSPSDLETLVSDPFEAAEKFPKSYPTMKIKET